MTEENEEIECSLCRKARAIGHVSIELAFDVWDESVGPLADPLYSEESWTDDVPICKACADQPVQVIVRGMLPALEVKPENEGTPNATPQKEHQH